MIALIIFFILYLNGNKFIIGKENVYYNQQLHNSLHPQVRSEYSNNENNSNENENERKKIIKVLNYKYGIQPVKIDSEP